MKAMKENCKTPKALCKEEKVIMEVQVMAKVVDVADLLTMWEVVVEWVDQAVHTDAAV